MENYRDNYFSHYPPKKKNFGYTLAEILLVLVITGILSNMILPSLITNVQNFQFRTAWKRVFADLNQANTRLVFEKGGSLKDIYDSAEGLMDDYIKYFVYIRKCTDDTPGNCWHKANQWYYLNGTKINFVGGYATYLSNGVLMMFVQSNTDCIGGMGTCGNIKVDVNGFKGPNKFGIDIFGTYIFVNKLVPFGSPLVGEDESTCAPNSDGWGCSFRYLRQ